MDIKVLNKIPQRGKNSALVVSLADGQTKPGNLPSATQTAIARVLKRGDLAEADNSHLILHDLPDLGIPRLVLLRLGKSSKKRSSTVLAKRAEAIAAAIQSIACDDVIVELSEPLCENHGSVADTKGKKQRHPRNLKLSHSW